MQKDLLGWLGYIERLHPNTIMMGLDRVKLMIARLDLNPDFNIVMVGGTNGKGSTTAMLESIYTNAGYQVACYTSPHITKYNERVRVNQQEISDDALCAAFLAIEHARVSGDEIALTYFEYGTLAAVWHFSQINIDVAILEVGLGGRLDAVNAFDADCAIVTNVGLDHQDYLGDTKEKIGFEKAGIFRSAKPAIFGDVELPDSVKSQALLVGANFKILRKDFVFACHDKHWVYESLHPSLQYELPLPALTGAFQLNNAACAVTAVVSLQSVLPVSQASLQAGLLDVVLPGRFEIVTLRCEDSKDISVIFDVAHNPEAAKGLAINLNSIAQHNPCKIIAVFAMLQDKDISAVIAAMHHVVDEWCVSLISQPRGASVEQIEQALKQEASNAIVYTHHHVLDAFERAIECCKIYQAKNQEAKIIVFGSFFTVSDVKSSHRFLT